MIQKTKTVQNDNVMVAYSYSAQGIYITEVKSNRSQIIGGFEDLYENFKAFYNSFSEEITFDDAVKFFLPNFKRAK